MTLPTKLSEPVVRVLVYIVGVAGAVNLLAQGIPGLGYQPNETLNGVWLALMSALLVSGDGKGEQ